LACSVIDGFHCGEEGAELGEEAFDLLVWLSSSPHVWPRDLGCDQQYEVADTSGEIDFPSEGGWALWALFGRFSGTSNWEEAPRQTLHTLKGFHVPSGLETPRGPPGGAGECRYREGCLSFPPEPVASETQTSDKRKIMDRWINYS